MDTKFELFDGGKSDANAPPSYEAVSMSSISTDSVQCRPPSVFSKEQTKQIRVTVISLIRDMVSAPDSISRSVGPIIHACSVSLPAAKFTALLQESNIGGHTLVLGSHVRLACMATNDHALFMRLGLESLDKPLRQSLGCPSDEVQVYGGDAQNKFTAKMQMRMLQKRMRIARNMRVELISQGRIWRLLFYMAVDASGHVRLSLAKHSLPACPKALLMVEAHNERPQGLKIQFEPKGDKVLAPEG
ncbi:hypothetical protein EV702DRAFT_1192380 [Suillus placidus]|uniref:Uncharacterized protein n=1 Tax=Suillus placidus TaxID=48579 RepID=A0A9P7A6Q5_9AGAM|nr:hypothetical protein EV702DRAFT_1192380 [Suillus placidus]